MKRPFAETLENVDEPSSVGSAASNDSQNSSLSSVAKIAKTEFVEEDEGHVTLSPETCSEPIDYSMSTDDTASEVEKIQKSPISAKELDGFQMFCHVCLKVLRCSTKNNFKCDELPMAQCFMCPRAIYCKTCIYSINHLKLHTDINVDIPLNKTD